MGAPPQSAAGPPGPKPPGHPPAAVGGRCQGTRRGLRGTPPPPAPSPPPLPPPPRPVGGAVAPRPPERAAAPKGGTPQQRRAQPHAKRPQSAAHALPHYPLSTSGSAPTPWAAAERRHPGVSRRSGPPRCPPGEGGREQTAAKRLLPPPPACHTDPPAADQAALSAHGCPATPTERVYPGGVPSPPEQGGSGQRRARRPSLPPNSPPGLRAAGVPALQPPPEAEEVSPLPKEGPQHPRGGAAGPARRTPPPPPPPAPAGVATGGRTHTSARGQRTDHARWRRATTNRSSMGAASSKT